MFPQLRQILILSAFAMLTLARAGAAPQAGGAGALTQAAQQLGARLDQLAATAQPPLFKRHLLSVGAVVRMEAARAGLYADADPKAAAEALDFVNQLIKAFDGDAAQWQTYVEGRRALILARLSKRDGTLQFAVVRFPAAWDPARAYPLLMFLHGSGPNTPLYFVANVGRGATVPFLAQAGFSVMPYGRGNTSYRDIGEIDVLEALDDMQQTFKIDPDRRYLYGFSMGGSGTWRVARRTPDLWAAVAPCGAGGPGVHPPAILARNVTYLPIWIFIGGKDPGFAGAKTLCDVIAQYGPAPVFNTDPTLAHAWPGEIHAKCVAWLTQHTRKRPDKFAFVADTDDHTGVWGITMKRDLAVGALPEFECAIAGNAVRIDSKGTAGLNVILGAGGLGLSGNVTVTWNGAQAYAGPATAVELGEGTRRLRR